MTDSARSTSSAGSTDPASIGELVLQLRAVRRVHQKDGAPVAALDGVDEVTVASVVTVDDLAREPRPRPEHYKVICISLYNEDLARLDELVRELKKRGFTKANRSAVLRAAVEQFDPERVQRGL